MGKPDSNFKEAKSKASYITGLDSIRFFCALWVVFFHGNLPPLLEGMEHSPKIAGLRLIRGIYGCAFNGPAAVIVFFLVSGFCIHFPQRNSLNVRIGEFYLRRFIRIGIPWLVASLLATRVGLAFSNFTTGIGWSLIAETSYYTFYPALLAARRKLGWPIVLSCSYAGCLLVMLSNPHAINYASYGYALNCLLGLPCWLLGCILAEKWSYHWQPSTWSMDIRFWRLGVWAFTDVILAQRQLGLIGDPWTLTLFAPLAYYWLRREIRHFQDHGAPKWSEWAGAWSYSIYLIHLIAAALYYKTWHVNLGYLLNWGIEIVFILAICYLFYLLVEHPSHKLAKTIGKYFAFKRSAKLPDAPKMTVDSGLASIHPTD